MSNFPIYYLSLYRAPKKIISKMERLVRNFLWGDTATKKGQHLIKWSTTKLSKNSGGLGILDLHNRNISLLGKWIWRYYVEEKALWRKVISAKYGSYHFSLKLGRKNLHLSHGPWKPIEPIKEAVYGHTSQSIGNGESTCFCYHNSHNSTSS